MGLGNNAAAEDIITVIEDCALAGGDRVHRFIKPDLYCAVFEWDDPGRQGRRLVADLHRRPNRRIGDLTGRPVDRMSNQLIRAQCLARPDNESVGSVVFANNIKRIRTAQLEPFALSNRVERQSVMRTQLYGRFGP